MQNLVVLENSLLQSMAGNERFTREFPFLKTLATARRPGCGRCGGRLSNRNQAAMLNTVKRMFHSLAAPQRLRLMTLLDTQKIQVVYQQPNGQTLKVTMDRGSGASI